MVRNPKKSSRRSARIQWPMLVIAVLACLVVVETLWLFRNHQRQTAVKSRMAKRAPVAPVPQPRPVIQPPVVQPPAEVRKTPSLGKIAVIIDDSGYNIDD